MKSRDVILSDIHRSLSVVQPSSLAVDANSGTAPASPSSTLVEVFSRELLRVDGEVHRVDDHPNAIDAVARSIESQRPHSVMVSGDPTFELHGYVRGLRSRLSTDIELFGFEKQTRDRIAAVDVAVLYASKSIAESGTLVMIPQLAQPRSLLMLPEMVVVVASIADLLPNMSLMLARLLEEQTFERSSSFVLMTGPSRTSDIEKVSVRGVHGPKRLVAVLVGQ